MASQNEPYLGKRKIYATRSVLWNKTLAPDFYHNHPKIKDLIKKYKITFKPYDEFNTDTLHDRQRLLFDLTKLIWE